MSRKEAIDAIRQTIGNRRLLWVGTRGTDAQPLLQIDQFSGVFGLIAPLGVPSWPDGSEAYLEQLSGERVDLNAYSIDEDDSRHVRELARRLRTAMVPETLVVAYRPTAFLAAAYYPRMEHATYLGMFHGHQAAFEHKPWVESELNACGVATIPWRYFSSNDRSVMLEWMEGRSCVLRANYSDGGIGLTLARAGGDPASCIPKHTGGFLAVAPMLEPSVPLNASGCVFSDGTVTVRHPSIQLIGIPSCTIRRFGYCGNDFAAVSEILGKDGIDQFEAIGQRTGRWLHNHGYLGAFGIDALLYGGEICLTEINPRFQGSSAAAASLAMDLEMSDIYLDHLSAFLGLRAPDRLSLHDQVLEQARPGHRLSQVVCYNTGLARRMRDGAVIPDLNYCDIKGAPDHGIVVPTNAMLFKLFVHDAVTSTGSEIPEWIAKDIDHLADNLYEPASVTTANLESHRLTEL